MMLERLNINLENVNDEPTEDGSSSPTNDHDTIFQVQMFELDYQFQRDPANICSKSANIERMEFVDVKATLEEQWWVTSYISQADER